MRSIRVCIALSAATVVGATGSALALGRSQAVTIKPGQVAVFRLRGTQYNCSNNRGRTVECVSGDALPDATLGPGRVTVDTLNGGHLNVHARHNPSPDPTDPNMQPYETITYTFTP